MGFSEIKAMLEIGMVVLDIASSIFEEKE